MAEGLVQWLSDPATLIGLGTVAALAAYYLFTRPTPMKSRIPLDRQSVELPGEERVRVSQALQRVSKELQAERTNRERLKAELEQCRLELASVKKELRDEKGTNNLLRDQLKQYVSDFPMEKQGHQRTAQDKRGLEQRLRDLERDFRKLQQDYDSRQSPKRLSHLYKVDSQEEPPRYPIHPLAPGGGVQDPRGAAGEDTAARRHPCPICGRTFSDLQKLDRHASNCKGN